MGAFKAIQGEVISGTPPHGLWCVDPRADTDTEQQVVKQSFGSYVGIWTVESVNCNNHTLIGMFSLMNTV